MQTSTANLGVCDGLYTTQHEGIRTHKVASIIVQILFRVRELLKCVVDVLEIGSSLFNVVRVLVRVPVHEARCGGCSCQTVAGEIVWSTNAMHCSAGTNDGERKTSSNMFRQNCDSGRI